MFIDVYKHCFPYHAYGGDPRSYSGRGVLNTSTRYTPFILNLTFTFSRIFLTSRWFNFPVSIWAARVNMNTRSARRLPYEPISIMFISIFSTPIKYQTCPRTPSRSIIKSYSKLQLYTVTNATCNSGTMFHIITNMLKLFHKIIPIPQTHFHYYETLERKNHFKSAAFSLSLQGCFFCV